MNDNARTFAIFFMVFTIFVTAIGIYNILDEQVKYVLGASMVINTIMIVSLMSFGYLYENVDDFINQSIKNKYQDKVSLISVEMRDLELEIIFLKEILGDSREKEEVKKQRSSTMG